MELTIGPFDPALHIRSRDHYEAIRREAQLLALQPDTPLLRLEALGERLVRQFPRNDIDDIVDDAYRPGAPPFTARVVVPDELVPAALAACDDLDVLIDDLDRWTEDPEVRLLPPGADVRAYRSAY